MLTISLNPTIYCLRIDILDSEPAIWRRFCVDAQLSLLELHKVLAAVMGWSGQGDYRLKTSGQRQGGTGLDIFDSDASIAMLTLTDLVTQPDDSFLYTYNLAQGWMHNVTLEALQPAEPDRQLPCCLEGERACPPEFCVGIWGYEELLDRLSDSDDLDCDQWWEQVGYDFDPEWFDLKGVNQRLQQLG